MAIPSLNYTGEATYIHIEKDGREYDCIQPKSIDKRIFLQKKCAIVGVDPKDLVSGAVYEMEISCFANIDPKGYLNFSAYLVNIIT